MIVGVIRGLSNFFGGLGFAHGGERPCLEMFTLIKE